MIQKYKAIILLLLTLFPLIMPIFVNTFFFFEGVPNTALEVRNQNDLLWCLGAFQAIWICLLIIYYIGRIFKSDQYDRMTWTILIILLNIFIMPIVWYKVIWKESKPLSQAVE